MAKKIGLFYGTQTGNTQSAAEMIQAMLGKDNVDLIDISGARADDFERYQFLIIGCPTWNVGELQADWDAFIQNWIILTSLAKRLPILAVATK